MEKYHSSTTLMLAFIGAGIAYANNTDKLIFVIISLFLFVLAISAMIYYRDNKTSNKNKANLPEALFILLALTLGLGVIIAIYMAIYMYEYPGLFLDSYIARAMYNIGIVLISVILQPIVTYFFPGDWRKMPEDELDEAIGHLVP